MLFVEKDREVEHCSIFLESMNKRVAILEENSQVNLSNLRDVKITKKLDEISCFSNLENLNEMVISFEKLASSK